MNDHLNPIHFIACILSHVITYFLGFLTCLFLQWAVKQLNKRHQQKAIDKLIKQNHSCDEGIMNEVIDKISFNKNSLF